VNLRARGPSHFGSRIRRVGVDHYELIHQLRVRYERLDQRAHHACDCLLLVPGRYYDADPDIGAPLTREQLL